VREEHRDSAVAFPRRTRPAGKHRRGLRNRGELRGRTLSLHLLAFEVARSHASRRGWLLLAAVAAGDRVSLGTKVRSGSYCLSKMRITLAAIGILVSVATAVAACSSGGEGMNAPDTGVRSAETSAAPPTETATQEVKAFVRTCETNVYGTLDPRGWQEHSIIAGPLGFWSADDYAGQPASLFTPVPGSSDRFQGLKLLVLVRPDAVATVIVPESERHEVALLYDPAAWNDRNEYRIEDGESAVTFEACKKGETIGTGSPLNEMTQFNGGSLVAGVRCVPLDVLVRGQAQAIRVTLSFGAGRCT
jgi:hypothetical protein